MTATLYSLGALTVAGYRVRTGDEDTPASAVSGALIDAQTLIEEELNRLLALDERTETMRIHQDSRVYPLAYPIVLCDQYVVDGRSLVGAIIDVNQFVALIGSWRQIAPRATVTYTGGFDATTLPITLRDALYDLAHARVSSPLSLLVGTSASVGDVSISGLDENAGGLDAILPGLGERVKKYRNRTVGP